MSAPLEAAIVLADGTLFEGERVSFTNGIEVEVDYVPVVEDGRVQGAMWRYRDITEQLRMQARLEAENVYLREAVTDADGNWTTKIVSTVYENHQDPYAAECKF